MKDLEIVKRQVKLSLQNDRYWHLPLLRSSCKAGPFGEQALSTPGFYALGEGLWKSAPVQLPGLTFS